MWGNLWEYMTEVSPTLVENFGYIVLFVTSFLETLPFIGFLSPGSTIANAGGFFVQIGVLKFAPVLAVLFLGMLGGDVTAFYMGRKLGLPFFEKLGGYFSISPEKIGKARTMVETHAGKALTLGRFIFPVRVFAPFFAGVSGVTPLRFILFSFAGCGLWALAMVVIGILFALGYELVAPTVGKIFLGALILGALLVWGFRSLKRIDHLYPRSRIVLFTGLVGAIIFLGKLVDDLVSGTFFPALDLTVFSALSEVRLGVFERAVSAASFLFNFWSVVVLTVGVLALLLWRRKYALSIIFLLATFGAQALTHILKNSLMLPRPPDASALLYTSGYGFPSAHAAAAAVFFLALLFIGRRKFRSTFLRLVACSVSVALILAVAFSRLYLEVHWFSDVLGGIAIGVMAVAASILITELTTSIYHHYRRHP